MPNKAYIKGVRKERAIVNTARERGMLAFRSAGSHSPVDVVVVNPVVGCIQLVQCKSDKMSDNAKRKLEKEYKHLNGFFRVRFRVI